MIGKIFKGNKLLKSRKVLYILAGILTLGVVLWGGTGERVPRWEFFEYESNIWEEDWVQVLGAEELALDSPSDFQSIEVGETLVLTNVIPTLVSDKVLLFYTKDLEVKVYVDDELIYCFEMQEKFEFLKTTGNKWNSVEIPMEMSGETIRIELTSQFPDRYMGTVSELYFVGECGVSTVLLHECGFLIIMSIIVLYMTLSAYVDAWIWQRKSIKRYFLALGTFCLSVALWLCSMSGIFNAIWNQPILSYLISMITSFAIPVCVYEFFCATYEGEHPVIKALGIVVWGNFILQFLLQFGFGISFLTLLPATFAVYAIGSMLVIYVLVQHILCEMKKEREDRALNFRLVSMSIFFAGAITEIVVLIEFPKRTDWIGVAGVTGLFVYLIVNELMLTRFEAQVDMDKLLLEENYNKLQNTALIQQIKAHYFFNTLNTISALCKQDAREADRAIRLFASYMYSYMHLINAQKNIPFVEEMKVVRSSLEIERLRFGDDFDYEIEMEYGDFKVPPLSIQPLVENAMVHGLRRTRSHGIIKITSRKLGDTVQVIVSDNGKGFDTAVLEKSESIGLKNLKQRIHIMAQGSVEIRSKVDVGTDVIITLPIIDENERS